MNDQNVLEFVMMMKKFIKDMGGKNIKITCIGRRNLAWSIKKKEKGIFINHSYLGNGSMSTKFDNNLFLNENVLLRQTIKIKKIYENIEEEEDNFDALNMSK
jgi:ribosomal protein S6